VDHLSSSRKAKDPRAVKRSKVPKSLPQFSALVL
jgi:hypothetical protein